MASIKESMAFGFRPVIGANQDTIATMMNGNVAAHSRIRLLRIIGITNLYEFVIRYLVK
jgi:hypothetical protein